MRNDKNKQDTKNTRITPPNISSVGSGHSRIESKEINQEIETAGCRGGSILEKGHDTVCGTSGTSTDEHRADRSPKIFAEALASTGDTGFDCSEDQ